MIEVRITLHRIRNNPYQYAKIEKEARKANVDKFPFSVFYIVKEKQINVFQYFILAEIQRFGKTEIIFDKT